MRHSVVRDVSQDTSKLPDVERGDQNDGPQLAQAVRRHSERLHQGSAMIHVYHKLLTESIYDRKIIIGYA